MKRLLPHKLKRRILLLYLTLLRNLKRPVWFITILSFIALIWASYIYVDDFIDVIYTPELSVYLSRTQIFLLFFAPLILLYINLLLVIRILVQRILRQPGSFLRFKIIGFFFLSIIIPSLIFTLLFINYFDNVLRLIDNEAVLKTLDKRLESYEEQISQFYPEMEQSLVEKIIMGNFQTRASDPVDLFLIFDRKGTLLVYSRKKDLPNDTIPKVFLTPILNSPKISSINLNDEFDDSTIASTKEPFYSYHSDDGYIYLLYQTTTKLNHQLDDETDSIINYYAAIKYVDQTLQTSIKDTLDLIKQVRQLNLLVEPTSRLTLILFIYLYFQIYSIAIIIFYYRSKTYTKPIEELILTTKMMAEGKWSEINLSPIIRKMDENEIKQLLESFSQMIKDFIANQERIDRLSNILAWKEVATRLAHELKNPLTPIILATNKIESHLTKHDFATYAELQPNFQFIHSEVGRIEKLVRDFSKISYSQTIEPLTFPIEDLVDKATRYFNHPNINFKTSIQWEGDVYYDQEKMLQVLINLIQNSIESVLERKEKINNFEPIIELKIYQPDKKGTEGKLVIEIIDNGMGVIPTEQGEVFKPYITHKEKGTGLGLTICEEIVALHQGNIKITSTINPTIFTITLPIRPSVVKIDSTSVKIGSTAKTV